MVASHYLQTAAVLAGLVCCSGPTFAGVT